MKITDENIVRIKLTKTSRRTMNHLVFTWEETSCSANKAARTQQEVR